MFPIDRLIAVVKLDDDVIKVITTTEVNQALRVIRELSHDIGCDVFYDIWDRPIRMKYRNYEIKFSYVGCKE